MDRTAAWLGTLSAAGIVGIAFAPIAEHTKAMAFTALASLGGAAGGMVVPHVAPYQPRRREIEPFSPAKKNLRD